MNRKSPHEYWFSSIPSENPIKNYVQFRTQFSQALKNEKAFSAESLIDFTEFQNTIEKEIMKCLKQKK